MNEFSDYNCNAKVVSDSTLQPKAYVDYMEIFNKMRDYYLEHVCQR